MAQYEAHSGRYYSDIEDGSRNRVDFAIIHPTASPNAVVVMKNNKWVCVYDCKDIYSNKENALPLLSKECKTNDEAYTKLMKVIGKMVKKSYYIKGTDHKARYYNNKQNKDYEFPPFISNKILMKPVYDAIRDFRVIDSI